MQKDKMYKLLVSVTEESQCAMCVIPLAEIQLLANSMDELRL